MADTIGQAPARTIDIAAGIGASALDAIRRPQRSARRAYRRGAGTTAAMVASTGTAAGEVAALPQRLVGKSLHVLRRQAAGRGVLSGVSRAALTVVHRPARYVADYYEWLTEQSQPPAVRGARPPRGGLSSTPVRSTTRRAAEKGRRAAGAARGSVRRAVASAPANRARTTRR